MKQNQPPETWSYGPNSVHQVASLPREFAYL